MADKFSSSTVPVTPDLPALGAQQVAGQTDLVTPAARTAAEALAAEQDSVFAAAARSDQGAALDVSVYVRGNVVKASDSAGNVIASGTAGLDDSTVIQAALDASENVVVRLAPSKTFTLLRGLRLGGAAGTCCKILIGAGRNSTVLDFIGTGNAAVVVDAATYFADGCSVSNLKIQGHGKKGLLLNASGAAAVSKGMFEHLALYDVSNGIELNITGSAAINRCTFQEIAISAISGNGILAQTGAAGCYNVFANLEIGGVGVGAYAIDSTQWGTAFVHIATDGCIRDQGQHSTWINPSIETIFTSSPPQTIAMDMCGFFHHISSVELINIDPTRCPTGFHCNLEFSTIKGLRCVGDLSPTYVFQNESPNRVSKTNVGIGIFGNPKNPPDTQWDKVHRANWDFFGCEFSNVKRGFTTRWTVAGDEAARTITLPLVQSRTEGTLSYGCTVKWGDGTFSTVTAYNDANRVHIYANDGTYDVEICGVCEGWSFNNAGDKAKCKGVVTWGDREKFTGFGYLAGGFHGCVFTLELPLEAIPAAGYGCLSQGFANTFNAQGFTILPAALFSQHPYAQSFYGVCFNSGLTDIQAGVFDDCASATTFEYAFAYNGSLRNVPKMLFGYNLVATNFNSAFVNDAFVGLRSDLFFLPGDEATRFLNQSPNFTSCFERAAFGGAQGAAPALWSCTFGTGTPTKTSCFAGAGNSLTSISNYADIPVVWT